MLIKLGLVLCLIILCTSFDMITVNNSLEKEIRFEKNKKFFVFEVKNTRKEIHEVMVLKRQENDESHNIYIYLNSSNINENFINYYRAGTFDKALYTINIDELLNKKFYIVISQTNISYSNNVYVKFFTPNSYIKMNSSVLTKSFYNSDFIVDIDPHFNGTYLKFGYNGGAGYSYYINFQIVENGYTVYTKKKIIYNEGYIKVNNSYSYTVYLNAYTVGDFYLILTDHLYYVPAEINTQDFQLFPVITTLNLSLDTTKIENKYRFLVEYKVKGSIFFDVFGYYTDDYNEIENTEGIKLEKLSEKKGINSNDIKSFYILKESSELKRVILKLEASNSGSIQIKFGEQEYYYGHNVSMSVLVGLGLSIPNLLFQILVCCILGRSAPWYSFLMNVLLHFAYGNIFSYPLHFGGVYSLIIGGFAMAIYVILFCCFSCYSCFSPTKLIFNQLNSSLAGFEELKTLEEIINENRKKPPEIKIFAKAEHKESREILKEYQPYQQDVIRNDLHVWQNGSVSLIPHYDHTTINFEHVDSHYSEWKRVDEGGGKIEGKPGDSFNSFVKDVQTRNVEVWKKNCVYKYASWQDCTKFDVDRSYYPIIKVSFDLKLLFNFTGKKGKQKVIDELCLEGKSHDTDVYYKEEYSCKYMKSGERCYFDKKAYNRVKAIHTKGLFVVGLILFILGYSSIIDCFTYYEEIEATITIEKLISGKKDLRAEYDEEDENLPSLEKSRYEMNLGLEDEGQYDFDNEGDKLISKYHLYN